MKFSSLVCRGALIIAPLGCGAQTLYDFGNPTADEQLYIELINRARANPSAEGVRLAKAGGEGTVAEIDLSIKAAVDFFNVNLTMLKSEFNAIAAAPPLAPNQKLTTIARSHSQWMLTNGIQAHNEGSVTLADRLNNVGYVYGMSGAYENIYASSKYPWFGHAGFQIDWGTGGTGGMQAGRGHRTNIHRSTMREIGVGVTYGTHANGTGPTQVTQDFGTQSSTYAYATGVAYYDLDGDDFYDPGEGISGLKVDVSNNVANFYCNTAIGGGWVVPVNNTALPRVVTFSGLNVPNIQDVNPKTLDFPGSTGMKHDLKLSYTAPAITSTNTANVGTAKTITFPATPGATGYKWHRWTTTAAAAEPCDNTTNVNGANSQMLGNSMTNTSTKDSGAAAFWLANYDENRGSRWIELSRLYRASGSPAMSFRSRLAWASEDEFHKVQIKEEGTLEWKDVYTQAGSNGSGESGFSTKTPSITAFANKSFRVRFKLDFDAGGTTFQGNPGNSDGWFIDNITFTNVQQLENDAVIDLATNTGNYTPSSTGSILQAIAPVIGGREFVGAYQTLTVAAALPPTFATWATNLEAANSLPAGTLTPANGDYDKDGRVNLLEYAFGTSPVTASEAAPRWPKIQSATATSIVIEYQVDLGLTDLTVTPEATLTLGTWYGPTHPNKPSGFVVENLPTINNIETRRATLPLTAGQKGFLRVKATQNP